MGEAILSVVQVTITAGTTHHTEVEDIVDSLIEGEIVMLEHIGLKVATHNSSTNQNSKMIIEIKTYINSSGKEVRMS